jgi:hypothetical protein
MISRRSRVDDDIVDRERLVVVDASALDAAVVNREFP